MTAITSSFQPFIFKMDCSPASFFPSLPSSSSSENANAMSDVENSSSASISLQPQQNEAPQESDTSTVSFSFSSLSLQSTEVEEESDTDEGEEERALHPIYSARPLHLYASTKAFIGWLKTTLKISDKSEKPYLEDFELINITLLAIQWYRRRGKNDSIDQCYEKQFTALKMTKDHFDFLAKSFLSFLLEHDKKNPDDRFLPEDPASHQNESLETAELILNRFSFPAAFRRYELLFELGKTFPNTFSRYTVNWPSLMELLVIKQLDMLLWEDGAKEGTISKEDYNNFLRKYLTVFTDAQIAPKDFVNAVVLCINKIIPEVSNASPRYKLILASSLLSPRERDNLQLREKEEEAEEKITFEDQKNISEEKVNVV